jgi:hypothetical protein
MHFRTGSNGGKALIGCGALLALSGLLVVTPLGMWLVRALGWIAVLMGFFFAIMGGFLWLSALRRRRF